jgi:hypothetical protein
MFKSENYYSAKTIFGDEVEIAPLSDQRIPIELRGVAEELDIPTVFDCVCVPCGTSKNLCSIWLPMFNQALINRMHQFFNYNPMLRGTTIIRLQKFITVWLHIDGWRPTTKFASGIFWFSSGILPLATAKRATRNDPIDYNDIIPRKAPPVMTIKFNEIIWSDGIYDTFLLERLENQHGKLFLNNVSNKAVFGSYTAAHFINEIYKLKYNHSDDKFTLFETGVGRQIDDDELSYMISEWLSVQAKKSGARYPRGKPEAAIINILRKICSSETTDLTGGQLQKPLATHEHRR